jgi:hypothetical protein
MNVESCDCELVKHFDVQLNVNSQQLAYEAEGSGHKTTGFIFVLKAVF